MNKPILFLTDYKGLFGSKQESAIYRGGMDVPLMIRLFKEQGYEANAVPFSHIDNEFIKRAKSYSELMVEKKQVRQAPDMSRAITEKFM